jgi:hypothetical protein
MGKVNPTSPSNQLTLFLKWLTVMPWHGSINAGVIHVWNCGHNNILSQLSATSHPHLGVYA